MRFLTELINPKVYKKILNLGAGEGRETFVLKQLGYDPVGNVRGAINLEYAKKNFPGIEFLDFDMHDIPFRSNAFDAIYMDQVFEHCYAPFFVLLEMYCVLKVGGMLYIKVPKFMEKTTPNDPSTIESCWISHHHPNVMPNSVLKQMFDKTGFKVIHENPDSVMFVLKKLSDSALHSDVANVLRSRDLV
jgi:ubiquinone/menaquinone biosynthesis C-methylase UbiE